jgi:hypothetical protein
MSQVPEHQTGENFAVVMAQESSASAGSAGSKTAAASAAKALLSQNPPNAVRLDWLLWERGEALLAVQGAMAPHHRTLSTYY